MVLGKAEEKINCHGGVVLPPILKFRKSFDLDNLQVEQKGEGEINDSGDFPLQNCQLKVIEITFNNVLDFSDFKPFRINHSILWRGVTKFK